MSGTESPRATCQYEGITIYVDEVALIESDGFLYGSAYLIPNAEGVHERVSPHAIRSSSRNALERRPK
jgi:hypothetical protein